MHIKYFWIKSKNRKIKKLICINTYQDSLGCLKTYQDFLGCLKIYQDSLATIGV